MANRISKLTHISQIILRKSFNCQYWFWSRHDRSIGLLEVTAELNKVRIGSFLQRNSGVFREYKQGNMLNSIYHVKLTCWSLV